MAVNRTGTRRDVSQMSIKDKQSLYHDWEARNYDAKFSISYDERCISYSRERFRKAIPDGGRFDHVLEVGAGTGFFVINLWQAGIVGRDVHVTDISQGMLAECVRNAAEHGLQVVAAHGDAEALPYADERFDLVIGHAFLHHLPDPAAAIREAYRILKPGGSLVVAGEPSLWGDRILRRVKRGTYLGFRTVTALPPLRSWRRPSGHTGEDHGEFDGDSDVSALEWEVDLHTFAPGDVEQIAHDAGFVDVRTVTEDLTANWFGWAVRTIEGSTAPGKLGSRWAHWAYRTFLRLQTFDERLLSRVVPRDLFYNVILHARKA
ncbi:MAG: class I SAM-dependent methyltransferase [Actinobacteria bacterium]|nr:class I SAM-dependent methyltransferase [Actinomycetota bacterium]